MRRNLKVNQEPRRVLDRYGGFILLLRYPFVCVEKINLEVCIFKDVEFTGILSFPDLSLREYVIQ
jgi:hypothetical protein